MSRQGLGLIKGSGRCSALNYSIGFNSDRNNCFYDRDGLFNLFRYVLPNETIRCRRRFVEYVKCRLFRRILSFYRLIRRAGLVIRASYHVGSCRIDVVDLNEARHVGDC